MLRTAGTALRPSCEAACRPTLGRPRVVCLPQLLTETNDGLPSRLWGTRTKRERGEAYQARPVGHHHSALGLQAGRDGLSRPRLPLLGLCRLSDW